MSPEALGLTMLLLMAISLMIGFPVAFTMMALALTFGFAGMGFIVFDLTVQRIFTVMQNDVLVAVPLFLFMGYLIERAGTLDSLFRALKLMFFWLPGSLAIATLFTGTIFATATGIVGAAVTLLTLMALPQMNRAGYNKAFSAGVIGAAGTLGIMIPPSVLFILYGFYAGVSVPRLYAGAFLPGFALSGLFLIYIVARSIVWKHDAPVVPKAQREQLSGRQTFMIILTGFVPITVLILAVMGAIFFGIATPTEGAALGALGGILLAILNRRFSFSMLKESIFLTVRAASMVGWLLVGSSMFAAVFVRLGGGAILQNFVNALNLSPEMFFWLSQFIIFLLGWPLEWTEITIIFMPIFLPLLSDFHTRFPSSISTDPFFFGIMAGLNQQTSFLTPPMAMSAYYMKGILGKAIELSTIFRGFMPFMVCQLLAMLVLWLFPVLAYGPAEAVFGKAFR